MSGGQNMTIGMLGGSFCPPTIAHLELSQKCIEMGYCDKVVWVPVNDAYRKSTNIPSQYRVDMVKLTLQNQENITCSLHELEYDRIIRTLESIKVLQARCPDDKIVFIAGADKMGMKWFQQEEFVRDFGFIVTNRGDIDCEEIIKKSKNLSKWKNNIKVLEYDSDISSTIVREEIRNTRNSDSISDNVLEYIRKNNLFV
jgi:nicotinate-nucleotide adenylyltransferase